MSLITFINNSERPQRRGSCVTPLRRPCKEKYTLQEVFVCVRVVPGISLAVVLSGYDIFKQLSSCHPVEGQTNNRTTCAHNTSIFSVSSWAHRCLVCLQTFWPLGRRCCIQSVCMSGHFWASTNACECVTESVLLTDQIPDSGNLLLICCHGVVLEKDNIRHWTSQVLTETLLVGGHICQKYL